MSGSALRIRASVRMQSASTLPIAKALSPGLGMTISYGGKLFPGRILECEKPIGPGKAGEAVIGMLFLTSSPADIGIRVGSSIELFEGPHLIASAIVVSLDDIADSRPQ
jgi:hypothetical protein